MMHALIVKNFSLLLLMTIHDICILIFFMKKSETYDAFKVYNAEVENQLFKQIKTRGQIKMVNIMVGILKGDNYKVHL